MHDMMGGMGTTRSRAYGVNVNDMSLLQGRVPKHILDAYRAAARASDVSMAYYLEALAEAHLAGGGMPLVSKPTQGPAPIDFSALEAHTDAA